MSFTTLNISWGIRLRITSKLIRKNINRIYRKYLIPAARLHYKSKSVKLRGVRYAREMSPSFPSTSGILKVMSKKCC